MIYYEAIVGSRCYGLELPDSDVDIVRVSEGFAERKFTGIVHNMQIPREMFFTQVTYEEYCPYMTQWFFPAEIISTGDTTDFILEHREKIISANLPVIYEIHMKYANGLAIRAEQCYPDISKRIAYAILYYDTIARYAADIPFEEAIKPEEDMRQKLLAIRRKDMLKSEALDMLEEARKRAESVADFYNKEPDKNYLINIKKELGEILRISTEL